METWTQIYAPLGSLGLSALVASLPIIFFFIALAVLRMGVSQRHVSFVENGRSLPSRELLLAWLHELQAPLALRNVALQQAGFAPVYRDSELSGAVLAPAREALARLAPDLPAPGAIAQATSENLRNLESLFKVKIRTDGHELLVDGDPAGVTSTEIFNGGANTRQRSQRFQFESAGRWAPKVVQRSAYCWATVSKEKRPRGDR